MNKPVYFIDLNAGYGPTSRLIFVVKEEQEILNRIEAIEEMGI